ncbi:MAG: hypothetical protein K2Q01_07995, partial [Rickettsiales bacterium]|nr:hypothetical protein [Rickettsiales bacterium]
MVATTTENVTATPTDASRAFEPKAAPANTPDAKPEPQQEAAPKKEMSKGEKLYSWGVYSGLNYWFNLGSSIVIADYFCNLKGKELLNKGAEKIASAFAKPGSAQHAKTMTTAQNLLKTGSLLSGGWLLIIPNKLM